MTTEHNTATLRQKIMDTFSLEDLKIMVFDYFPYPLFVEIDGKTSLSEAIQSLFKHCKHHREFDKLSSVLKSLRPNVFSDNSSDEQYLSRLETLLMNRIAELTLRGRNAELQYVLVKQDAQRYYDIYLDILETVNELVSDYKLSSKMMVPCYELLMTILIYCVHAYSDVSEYYRAVSRIPAELRQLNEQLAIVRKLKSKYNRK